MDIDPNYLLLALLVSSIGFVFFVYGKRQRRPMQFGGGLILLVYPYFVHDLTWMTVVAVVVIVTVWVGVKLGL